jgi:hypothetical protein
VTLTCSSSRRAVRDDHQPGQRPEGQRLDGERVRRPDRRGMIGEERAPGLARGAGGTAPPVQPDRALADGDPHRQQLASEALAAPARGVPRHLGAQPPELGAQPRATQPRAGLPAPEALPALPVPAEDGLRPHDEQVLAPITPEATGQSPEESVARPEPRPLASGASQHGELLTQHEVLDGQLGTTADGHNGGQVAPTTRRGARTPRRRSS